MVARVESEAGKGEASNSLAKEVNAVAVPDRGAETRSLWSRVVDPLRLFVAR